MSHQAESRGASSRQSSRSGKQRRPQGPPRNLRTGLLALPFALVVTAILFGALSSPTAVFADTVHEEDFGTGDNANVETHTGSEWSDSDGDGEDVRISNGRLILRNGGITQTAPGVASTEGFENIVVNFSCRGAEPNDDAENEALALLVDLDGDGGEEFEEVERWQAGPNGPCGSTDAFVEQSVSLPAGAADNPDLRIRLRGVGFNDEVGENVRVEYIEITGDPLASEANFNASITKTNSTDDNVVDLDESFDWLVTLNASGENPEPSTFTITDTVPEGFTVDEVTDDSDFGDCTNTDNEVSCEFTFSGVTTEPIEVTISVTPSESVCEVRTTNTADLVVDGPEESSADDNTDTDTVFVECDDSEASFNASIMKTNSSDDNVVDLDESFDWLVTLNASGDNPDSSTFTITDTVPEGFTVDEVRDDSDFGDCTNTENEVSCEFTFSGVTTEPIEVTISVTPSESVCEVRTTNTADLVVDGPEESSADDNTDTDTVFVECEASEAGTASLVLEKECLGEFEQESFLVRVRDDGGEGETINDEPLTCDSTSEAISVNVGESYSVSETNAGEDVDDVRYSGVCDGDGSFTVAEEQEGETITCVVTNVNLVNLTLTKDCEPDELEGGPFSVTVYREEASPDTIEAELSLTCSGETQTEVVEIDDTVEYVIEETEPGDDIVVSYTGDCTQDGEQASVTSAGEDVTCTIVNESGTTEAVASQITLVKEFTDESDLEVGVSLSCPDASAVEVLEGDGELGDGESVQYSVEFPDEVTTISCTVTEEDLEDYAEAVSCSEVEGEVIGEEEYGFEYTFDVVAGTDYICEFTNEPAEQCGDDMVPEVVSEDESNEATEEESTDESTVEDSETETSDTDLDDGCDQEEEEEEEEDYGPRSPRRRSGFGD